MNNLAKLADFTNEELKSELKRREKKEKNSLLPSSDYKKRMNIAIKKGYSKETEDEILAVMLMMPNYENNIQKALTWGIKTKSKALVEAVIKTYKDFSSERYLNFIPFGIELEEILFMLDIDVEVAKAYLDHVFADCVENEIQLLRMKRQGSVENIYHEWRWIHNTGYDKEIHRANRKKINNVLEQAKESYPYNRIFRKVILTMLRYVESCAFDDAQKVDFIEAIRFLRWQGARWKICEDNVQFTQRNKMKNTLYTGFQEGALSVIVGKSGTGKTCFLQCNSIDLDSNDTLIIDHASSVIYDPITRELDAKDKFFPQSTYIDIHNKLNLPLDEDVFLNTKTLIIDEAHYVFNQRRVNGQIDRLINSVLSNNGRVIVVFQHESGLKTLGKHENQADHVEEIDGTPGSVKIYTFKQEKQS